MFAELDNFVKKFHQLRQAGYNAHLDVDSQAGQVSVALRVQLGAGAGQAWPRRRRSPSYFRRMERRKADREAAARSSTSDKLVCDNVPAEEASSVSKGDNQEEFSDEAATVSLIDKPSNEMNWINGINEIEKGFYTISNLQAIIIDTISSIERIENYRHGREITCRHCKRSIIEHQFGNHGCYSEENRFQDEVLSRVEPGSSEVRSILCL